MYFAVIFIVFMIVVMCILALFQKITGIKIFDDTPMEDDWFHW